MKKVLLCITLFFIVNCTQKIAGTTDETLGGNKTAAIYYANGAPAPGVTVKAFDVNDTSRVPAAQAITDNTGHYALGQIAKGTYNIWAEQDTLVAVQDSVYISPTTNTIHQDTLQASGSLTAIIGMQPNDDPRSAYVQMTGSDRFSRNINANGSFTINGLATGSYSLRISTTLPNYTPTFFTVSAVSGKSDTLKDTLQLVYTGIPLVTGLSAVYDTANGTVHLTWNSTQFRDFQDYLIFRDPCDSIQPSTVPIKKLTDTVFTDTIFNKNKTQGQYSFSDSNNYCFDYRICIRNNSNMQGLTYKNIAVIAVSPLYKVPQVKIVSSDTMFCNTPFTLSASVAHNLTTITKCEWKIGQNGQYATTSITQPETTIVFPDTLLPSLRCYIRVTNNLGNIGYDSMDLQVSFGWTQVTIPSNFSSEWRYPMNEIVFNNQLFCFCGSSINSNVSSIWTSSDGMTWAQLTNSVPFIPSTQLFLSIFNNELWALSDSMVWHSSNGTTWNFAGSVPINQGSIAFFSTLNNTLYIGDASSTNGTIWVSNNGTSWNILKSADGSQIAFPSINSFNQTSIVPWSISTVLIGDTLFYSSTSASTSTTTIWKISNWESPALLAQDNSGYSAPEELQLFNFQNHLSLVVGFTPIIYLDNTGFHLFSDPTKVTDIMAIMTSGSHAFNYVSFKGKIFALIINTAYGYAGGEMWATK